MIQNIEEIPAYCISLDRRVDRWQRFMGQTVAAGLHVKRWSAVDGRTIDVEKDERISVFARRNIVEKTRRSHEEIDSIGAVGCALSHIALWKALLESPSEYFLIFEDDAVVPADFVERANVLLRSSTRLRDTSSWDVWMLGGAWKAEQSDIDTARATGEPAVDLGRFYLIHGYVINRRAAAAFLANCFPIQAHIDHYMSMCARFAGIRVIGSPQLKLRQAGQASDIQMKSRCTICDIPADVEGVYLWKRENVGVAAAVLGIIVIAIAAMRA
jgi:glycosyl transferase family 25